MALNWNEIKTRAVAFSKEWENASNEDAEAQSFTVAFLNVFGITNRVYYAFEHKVRKRNDKDGFIDFFWKGKFLIEMKSRGKNLENAFQQAIEYTQSLESHDLPKVILICDFEKFVLYSLEDGNKLEFQLSDLVHNVQNFNFLLEERNPFIDEQDPANIKAAELMGKLHDRLKEIGYDGHPLEVYLVRILFCLFAEDTTIFNKLQFQQYIEQRTSLDGSDLASKLQELFQVLNTPHDKRFKNLDIQLDKFPYVNGKLFEETLPIASFDSKMRNALLECCFLDWSKISPAIFGSMFQSVMNPKERRNLGAHYTSEKNILKVIRPLFLDELWDELDSIKNNKSKLIDFHEKISNLKFLDPACGCGNFLIITYRELRFLELEILKRIDKTGQGVLNVKDLIKLDVDMMYGIEYEEFPARIAEVAMWLIDHQMNMLVSSEFGQYFVRLPLSKSATIVHGDALAIEWQSLLNPSNEINIQAKHANIFITKEPELEYKSVNIQADSYSIQQGTIPPPPNTIKFDYILGNPPFIGSKLMTEYQRQSVVRVFDNIQGAGVLDYVTAWYCKAAQYIQNTEIKVAFVSTNSIVQGEQVAILWQYLLQRFSIKIHFAHRTFKWGNEAKGNAAVYCVIIGFGTQEAPKKYIFDYEDIKGDPEVIQAKNINPYLVDAKNVIITRKSNPICEVPSVYKGNQPTDGGFLILSQSEKDDYLVKEPNGEKFIKNLVSGREFLNGENRYCFWILDSFKDIRSLPLLQERVKKCKEFRLKSTFEDTRKLAEIPYQFRDLKNPETFIVIPATTSENRLYIPFGFLNKDYIPSNSVYIIPSASLFHFGVLTSKMHMAWVKYVCGRLKSDFRYSKDIVYNNYPWPQNPTDKQIQAIEKAAQKALDVRLHFPNSSLADLYDPLSMPPALVQAHNELDKAVDLAYRPQPFTSEANRMEYLFDLYEQYTATLFTKEKVKKGKKK